MYIDNRIKTITEDDKKPERSAENQHFRTVLWYTEKGSSVGFHGEKIMAFLQGIDRQQITMQSLDSMIDQENPVRIIDAFVNSLDLKTLGFKRAEAATEGRPAYPNDSMLKLYLYGNSNQLRSSRRLQKAARVNIEVIWLMNGLTPDFRTISDFRKENIGCMKKVFHEFNKRVETALDFGFVSIDGSKFQANNAKDRNFTQSKLDDRIKRLDIQSEEYLRLLELSDEEEESEGQFTRKELEEKLENVRERKERYEGYLRYMEENNLSQLSLTDADAKLMKSKNGYQVSYNVQTAVDSETHLVRDYNVTTQATDHGLLAESLEGLKKEGELLESVADKGYHDTRDMAECLEKGIIPNVILPDGKDGYELEVPYEEREGAEALKDSREPELLKTCLRAGVIPSRERRIREPHEEGTPFQAEEEMKARAAEGFFVRDHDADCVYCPAGEKLRRKSIKRNGDVRYANKLACKRCKHKDKCTKSEWKEVDFPDKATERVCKSWKAENEQTENGKKEKRVVKITREIKKYVRLMFKPDRRKMALRMCLSEHPFGTMKRTKDAAYFLLRGKRKTDGEFALIAMGYNQTRAFNLMGFEKMMAVMG